MTEFDLEHYFNRVGRDIQGFMDRLTKESTPGFNPSADVSEDDEAVRIEMDLPGMSKQDIAISYKERILTVKGTRKIEAGEERAYHRRERRPGSFSRSFPVTGKIDSNAVKATFKDGVLTILLPKTETQATSTTIPIN